MRRFIEIGAVVIARARWIDGKSDGAAQHFVGACGTKAFPAEDEVLALSCQGVSPPCQTSFL